MDSQTKRITHTWFIINNVIIYDIEIINKINNKDIAPQSCMKILTKVS